MSESTEDLEDLEITVSCGDETFTLTGFAVSRCELLNSHVKMCQEEGIDYGVIPLPNIDAQYMPDVIKFLEHSYDQRPKGTLTAFELSLMPEDKKDLFQWMMMSNYLGCNDLLNVTTQHVANLMKGKTPEELRKIFNTPDDLPEEEKRRIRKENEFLLEK